MPQSLINLLDATKDKESDDEEMEMEPQNYESDDEDEEQAFEFLKNTIGLGIGTLETHYIDLE